MNTANPRNDRKAAVLGLNLLAAIGIVTALVISVAVMVIVGPDASLEASTLLPTHAQ